jgi:hypothetical protein
MLTQFSPRPFCTGCSNALDSEDSFCGNCRKPVKRSDNDNDDVQIIGSIPSTASHASSFPTRPSDQASKSAGRMPSSSSSITNEVRANKAATIKKDRANSKDVLPTSAYGVDPRGKSQQQRTAELFTVEKGAAPVRIPGALKRLKLLPHESIYDWSTWVREQAHGFNAWHAREDPDNLVEDQDRRAFVAVIYSAGGAPAELDYDPGTALAVLLGDIPDDGKSKIGLVIPVRNLEKEEAKSLAVPPASKRQKSPSGDAIPRRGDVRAARDAGGGRRVRSGRGGRGGRKGSTTKEVDVKEEVKVEEEAKLEEEEEEDSELPSTIELVHKRKFTRTSRYPENEYDLE